MAIKGKAQIDKQNQHLEKLCIEYLPLDAVHPNDYNPNRQSEHEYTLLMRSIQEDGFTQPVIVASDGTIVDGEHRWRAAQQLGIDEIPIVRVPMEAAQARIATLRHNRARGSEDIELAVDVLRDLEKLGALDWAADSLDLSDAELNRLLEDIPAPDALAGDEFTDAWAPQRKEQKQGAVGPNNYVDQTPAAQDITRNQEKRLREVKTEQERQAIIKDAKVYNLHLTFAGEEADVVKGALGKSPATTILEWCRTR